ncbi:MAG: reverse transcriptase family protein [Planctomycetaceae bacterium]
MNTPESAARRLAVAILAGKFEKEAILQRTLPIISGSITWMKRLVNQIIKRFGNQRPRRRDLVTFLLHSRGLSNASEQEDFQIRAYDQAADFLPSPGLFENVGVRQLRSVGEIGEWFGLEESELLWFADRRQLERVLPDGPLRHYRYHWKLKRHGKCRLIEAPKFRLRAIQRKLLREILNQIPVHNAAHGFRKNRSAQSHAAAHVGKAIVLKMDLEDFVPSIAPAQLVRILMHVGYPEDVAEVLTALSCNHVPYEVFSSFPHMADGRQKRHAQQLYCRPHFPQGAPTSPAIANVCAFRMDRRLAGLARSANAVYTRYADDLLFSGDEKFARSINHFRISVAAIAIEEGFTINHHKTRVMKRSVRQEAVGLVLNEKLNTRRDEFDRLKAILHRCVLHGPAAVNEGRHADLRSHLRGRIQYVAQTNQGRHAKLSRLFEQIDWSD